MFILELHQNETCLWDLTDVNNVIAEAHGLIAHWIFCQFDGLFTDVNLHLDCVTNVKTLADYVFVYTKICIECHYETCMKYHRKISL